VLEDRIRRNLALAKKASEFSDFPQHQLGCVLSYGKSILSVGWNSNSTHPTQAKYNQFRNLFGNRIAAKSHAEERAIEAAKHFENINWKKVTVYIYRQHKDGCTAIARPCAACYQLIKDVGIRKIIYSDSNPFGYTQEIIS
jgi:deoxycytidylate deaminase